MTRLARSGALGVLLAGVAVGALAGQTPGQPPVFRSAVEVTSIDAIVVDGKSRPITDLGADEFSIEIDGKPRRVASAEWVPMVPGDDVEPPPPLPEGYSSNEGGTAGRLVVLVVDQPNIRFGGGRAVIKAASDFLDTLQPADRVAVVGFGLGAQSTAFLADRERSKRAIAGMHGQMEALGASQRTASQMALSEALAIDRGDFAVRQGVIERECSRVPVQLLPDCIAQVDNDARAIALEAGREGTETIRGLGNLLKGLAAIDAPKTMVIITEGFVLQDGVESPVVELGSLAAAARTSIYALQLDDNYFDISEPGMPLARGEDREQRTTGVSALAAASRGTLLKVIGTGQNLFEQIASEISGYYLLGVESDPADRDGKPHPIRVRVSRSGSTVRARRTLLDRASISPEPLSMRQQVMLAITSPLLVSALPLRVVTFSLRDQDPAKVQLLIHADVGTEYTGSRPVAVAYVITDMDGRQVQSLAESSRAGPVMNGVPSPLLYTAGASLPPGDYRLKIAVAEGDRAGSVEHVFHAGLLAGGTSDLSDLMVGGPVDLSPRLQPLVTPVANFGVVQGYLEAYGPTSSALRVRYEVSATPDGPTVLADDATARPAGSARTMFSHVLPIRQLPPGAYYLRAIVSENGDEVSRLTRAFDVAPPSVLMTSVTGVGDPNRPEPAELFLPVEQSDFVSQFQTDEALAAPALDRFEALVDQSVRPAFDAGLARLKVGDYAEAESRFKEAIRPEVDSTPALAYLAATYAASGHDQEAAGAWQTALIDGGDIPELYRWLAEALLRDHDLNAARSILDEAAAKWPSDPRITRPLALVYATFGQGREAVRTMERYLEARPDDTQALERAVEWIYNLKLAGASAHSPQEDAGLAQKYAAAYEQAGGEQLELMRQWLVFLNGSAGQ